MQEAKDQFDVQKAKATPNWESLCAAGPPYDVFVGVEHRLRDDELQESFNKLGNQGYKYAADDARSTSEGQETPLHTSGGGAMCGCESLGLGWLGGQCRQSGRDAEIFQDGVHIFLVLLARWRVESEEWSTHEQGVENGGQRQLVMLTWILPNSTTAIGSMSPRLKFKLRRKEAPRTVPRALEKWKFENAGPPGGQRIAQWENWEGWWVFYVTT